jgi:hypothetical protein
MPWPLYPQERDLVPIIQEAEWAPELVWTGNASKYVFLLTTSYAHHIVCKIYPIYV